MRKCVSITLLLVLLFYSGGYYFLFFGLNYSHSRELSRKIDAEIRPEFETYELKVQLSLPYPAGESSYRRGYGEFEHNGEYYMIAKQKLENDTLYIIYVRNSKRALLNKKFTEISKLTNEGATPGSKPARALSIKVMSEYTQAIGAKLICHSAWSRILGPSIHADPISERHLSEVLHPPEVTT